MKIEKKPLVTIYIPTKNRYLLLKRALYSVLTQTYNNIEVIIVDDGSEDNNLRKIKALVNNFSNVTLITQKNLGACVARNKAIDISKGEFITGLDDDDVFLPDRIESFIEEWSDNYVAICSEQRNIRPRFKFLSNIPKINRKLSFNDIKNKNLVGNQVFCRTETLKNNNFDESLPALQDWELWLRLTFRTKKPILKIGLISQYIDTNHGCIRITNLERRINAINFIKIKYPEYGDLSYIQRQWMFDNNPDVWGLFKVINIKNIVSFVLKKRNHNI